MYRFPVTTIQRVSTYSRFLSFFWIYGRDDVRLDRILPKNNVKLLIRRMEYYFVSMVQSYGIGAN